MKLRLANLVVALALPLSLSACGGLDFLGSDGGTDGASACPGVTTVYAVPSGTYTLNAVQSLSDTCNTGVTAAALEGSERTVTNEAATGTITVSGAAGNPTPLGVGPVRCNAGTLIVASQFVTDPVTGCGFNQARNSTFVVNARGNLTLNFSETRTGQNSKCNPQTDCAISFTAGFTLKQ